MEIQKVSLNDDYDGSEDGENEIDFLSSTSIQPIPRKNSEFFKDTLKY